ncbi:MAG: nucleotide exchange factor GrpE [Neisseriaceae bacterium]|nr:nucleotide exchange factor GrpE [Neisseriaceae bacterium]
MSKKMNEQNNPIENQEDLIAEQMETAPEPTIEDLQQHIEDLKAQLQDQELRLAAARQNADRRRQEEVQNAHKYAGAAFAKEMLPVKDFLEMALKDQSGNFEALKMGVEMTLKQLVTAFNNVKVAEIDPIGQPFDPNLHQAMKKEKSDTAQPNTVIAVMQKGYTLNDRILRPALVTVAE